MATLIEDKKNNCGVCGSSGDDIYIVSGMAYCQDCHDKLFIPCENCGESVNRRNVYLSPAGSAYCEDCYNDRYFFCQICDTNYTLDDYCGCGNGNTTHCVNCCEEESNSCKTYLQNPSVSVKEVKATCKLIGLKNYKVPIVRHLLSVNHGDYRLSELSEKVGLINEPLYAHGLKDREEYSLLIPPDTEKVVIEFLARKGWKYKHGSSNSLAVSYSLRDKEFGGVIELVKLLGGVKSKTKKEGKLLCAV